MGSKIHDLKVYTAYEPRLELGKEREWIALQGAKEATPMVYAATSSSNNAWNFNPLPPAVHSVMDRQVVFHTEVTFNLTATNTGTNELLQPGRFALRSFPLASVMTNLNVNLNGAQCSIVPYHTIHAMSRFQRDSDLVRTIGSIYPQMDDNYQDYDDADGANNNPLALYGDNAFQQPRGAYRMKTITNGTTSATIVVDLYEYLFMPPFIYNGRQHGGLTKLNTNSINATFQNLPHMLSMNLATLAPLGISLTNVTASFASVELYVTWLTPRLTESIPPIVRYPYFKVNEYITSNSLTPIASGSQVQLVSNVQVLNTIPLKIYIYANRLESDTFSSIQNMVSATDTFTRIDSIQVQFNNRTGLLSAAKPIQLYEMSYQNGLSMSAVEWMGRTQKFSSVNSTITTIGTTGSIICLNPVKDLSLDENLSDGVIGQFNLQVILNVTNVSKNAIPIQLNVITVSDGILELENGQGRVYESPITQLDVLEATKSITPLRFHHLERIYGSGDFFGKLGEIAGNVKNFLKDTKVISSVLKEVPGLSSVGRIAKHFGYGNNEEDYMEGCSDGENMRYSMSNGVGGKKGSKTGGVRAGILTEGGAAIKKSSLKERSTKSGSQRKSRKY